MAGQPLKRAHELIADQLLEDITPPTARRSEPESYSEDLIGEMIEMARRGFTPAEIADHWAISLKTLQTWVRDYPAFGEAMERARTSAQAWWEGAARKAMATKDNRFPAGAWAMVMRGRYPEYREKVEVNAHVDLGALVVIQRPLPAEAGRREPLQLGESATELAHPDLIQIDRPIIAIDRPEEVS